MRVFSLFSGIGGFDLAMRNLGHEIVGACEIDKYARTIYARHFPNVRIWEDARSIEPREIPDFDILCAGFPCQAFSVAGKRLGFEDTRGTLFYEIARIAIQKRPGYLFLENVRGLLNHDNGRTFATIIHTFYKNGYDVEWQVINSKYFVPQTRERVFIIGHSREKPTRPIFPITTSDPIFDGAQGKAPKKGQWLRSQICGTIDANYKKGAGSRTMIFYNNEKIRRLTPLECERLQGFPDNWTDGISDSQRYKSVGNAVTVPVVEFIAKNFEVLA